MIFVLSEMRVLSVMLVVSVLCPLLSCSQLLSFTNYPLLASSKIVTYAKAWLPTGWHKLVLRERRMLITIIIYLGNWRGWIKFLTLPPSIWICFSVFVLPSLELVFFFSCLFYCIKFVVMEICQYNFFNFQILIIFLLWFSLMPDSCFTSLALQIL